MIVRALRTPAHVLVVLLPLALRVRVTRRSALLATAGTTSAAQVAQLRPVIAITEQHQRVRAVHHTGPTVAVRVVMVIRARLAFVV